MCLDISDLLSDSLQYHQKNISSSMKLFLQVKYVQIKTTLNKTLILKWKTVIYKPNKNNIPQYVSIQKQRNSSHFT